MQTLNRETTPIRMRNYGRIIQDMLEVAAQEPNQASRERMTIYIAQCMRQKNILWNKDQDTGLQRVKDDIAKITDGRLSTDFPTFDAEVMRPKRKKERFQNSERFPNADRKEQDRANQQ